jgi:ubiquitin-protein ligase
MAERFQFPGQPQNNFIVFKGAAMDRFGQSYKLKFIIPSNYPMSPPMCYFDQNLPQEVVRRLDYIGQQNMLTIPYLQRWNPQQSNLTMMVNELMPVVMNNPPVLQNPQYQ